MLQSSELVSKVEILRQKRIYSSNLADLVDSGMCSVHNYVEVIVKLVCCLLGMQTSGERLEYLGNLGFVGVCGGGMGVWQLTFVGGSA